MRVPIAETVSDDQGAFEFDAVGFLPDAFIEASRDDYEPAQLPLPKVRLS